MTNETQFGSSFGGSATNNTPVETKPENHLATDSSVDDLFNDQSDSGEKETPLPDVDIDRPSETPETESDFDLTDPVPLEDDSEYEPDVPNESSPNGGEFKWDDIRRSVEFTRQFMESSKESRAWFRWVMNMNEDTSVVYILKRLRDYDGSIWALDYARNLINTLSGEEKDMMEVLRIGAELSNLDVDSRRSLFSAIERLANSFKADPAADDITMRYRKNMDDSQFMNQTISSISAIDSKEALKNLDWAFSMIAVWNS